MNAKRTSARLARELNSVRQRKIKSLKTKIFSGKYKIENMEIAKALFMAQ